jgi:hypothetical protein
MNKLIEYIIKYNIIYKMNKLSKKLINKKQKTKKKIKKQRKNKTERQRQRQRQRGGNLNKLIVIDESFEKLNNTINNNNLYKIKINNCNYFFYIPDNTNYIIINEQYIIKVNKNINRDGDDDIQEIINIFNDEDIKYSRKMRILLDEYKVRSRELQCIDVTNRSNTELYDANEQILKYNKKLKETCPKLYLKLDYLYNLNGNITSLSNNMNLLTLCLYNEDENCISSINIDIKNDYIIINSETNPTFQNKKYNKLLRSVVIVICSFFNKKSIISVAENPISAWLLINYFNAYIDKNNRMNDRYFSFINNKGYNINDKNILKKTIFEYNKTIDESLVVNLELNDNNIENAEKIFNKTLNEIYCQ